MPQILRLGATRKQMSTAYQRALEKHPILVQAFQVGLYRHYLLLLQNMSKTCGS